MLDVEASRVCPTPRFALVLPLHASARRFDARLVDDTSLAVWIEGSGPPLVLVHSSIADHTTFDPFVDVLRHDWTT